MVETKSYGTVLIKAKAILDYLMEHDSGLTLKEIHEGMEMSKSTTLKILTTMCELDLLWRNDEDKKYHLGAELIGLGQKALSDFNIHQIALPYLKQLRNATEETVHLGVEIADHVEFLEKLESPRSVNLKSKIGGRLNLYSSAMGKAIMATKSQDELEQYFDCNALDPLTKFTVVNKKSLMKQIDIIRRNGYSIDDRENEVEVFCIGTVLEKHNQVYGAFSVSTPYYRMDEDREKRIIKLVLETKQQIEQAI